MRRLGALHDMRSATGAVVEVSKRDEFFRNSSDRAIVIVGNPEQISACQQMTLDLLSQNGYHQERSMLQQQFARHGWGSPPSPMQPVPLL